jgi:prepilin-type N-terminal cleavage/methylation domain-containing protein
MILPNENGPKGGFTLLELILVVFLISIFTFSSLPQVKKSFRRSQLKAAANDLENFMYQNSYLAVREVCPVIMDIDVSGNTLLRRLKEGNSGTKTLSIPSELRMETDKKRVIFYPDGRIDPVGITLFAGTIDKTTLTTKGMFSGIRIVTK